MSSFAVVCGEIQDLAEGEIALDEWMMSAFYQSSLLSSSSS